MADIIADPGGNDSNPQNPWEKKRRRGVAATNGDNYGAGGRQWPDMDGDHDDADGKGRRKHGRYEDKDGKLKGEADEKARQAGEDARARLSGNGHDKSHLDERTRRVSDETDRIITDMDAKPRLGGLLGSKDGRIADLSKDFSSASRRYEFHDENIKHPGRQFGKTLKDSPFYEGKIKRTFEHDFDKALHAGRHSAFSKTLTLNGRLTNFAKKILSLDGTLPWLKTVDDLKYSPSKLNPFNYFKGGNGPITNWKWMRKHDKTEDAAKEYGKKHRLDFGRKDATEHRSKVERQNAAKDLDRIEKKEIVRNIDKHIRPGNIPSETIDELRQMDTPAARLMVDVYDRRGTGENVTKSDIREMVRQEWSAGDGKKSRINPDDIVKDLDEARNNAVTRTGSTDGDNGNSSAFESKGPQSPSNGQQVAKQIDKISEAAAQGKVSQDYLDRLRESDSAYNQLIAEQYDARQNGAPMRRDEIADRLRENLREQGNSNPRPNTDELREAVTSERTGVNGTTNTETFNNNASGTNSGASSAPPPPPGGPPGGGGGNDPSLAPHSTPMWRKVLDIGGVGGDLVIAGGAATIAGYAYDSEYGREFFVEMTPLSINDSINEGNMLEAEVDTASTIAEYTAGGVTVFGTSWSGPASLVAATGASFAASDVTRAGYTYFLGAQSEDPEKIDEQVGDSIIGAQLIKPHMDTGAAGLGHTVEHTGAGTIAKQSFSAGRGKGDDVSETYLRPVYNTVWGLGEHTLSTVGDGLQGAYNNYDAIEEDVIDFSQDVGHGLNILYTNPPKAVNQAGDFLYDNTVENYVEFYHMDKSYLPGFFWDSTVGQLPDLNASWETHLDAMGMMWSDMETSASVHGGAMKLMVQDAGAEIKDGYDYVTDINMSVHLNAMGLMAKDLGNWVEETDWSMHGNAALHAIDKTYIEPYLNIDWGDATQTLWRKNIAAGELIWDNTAGAWIDGDWGVIGDTANIVGEVGEHGGKLSIGASGGVLGSVYGVGEDFLDWWNEDEQEARQTTDANGTSQQATQESGGLSSWFFNAIGISDANAASDQPADFREEMDNPPRGDTVQRSTGSAAYQYVGRDPLFDKTESISKSGAFDSAAAPGADGPTSDNVPQHVQPLLNVIADSESSASDKGYNMLTGHNDEVKIEVDGVLQKPEDVTIGDIIQWQEHPDQQNMDTAIGKYQFLDGTLRDLVRNTDVKMSDEFDPAMQDYLAVQLLQGKHLSSENEIYNEYLEGNITKEAFLDHIAGVWAGVPKEQIVDSKGRIVAENGQYDHMSNNNANGGYDHVMASLEHTYIQANAGSDLQERNQLAAQQQESIVNEIQQFIPPEITIESMQAGSTSEALRNQQTFQEYYKHFQQTGNDVAVARLERFQRLEQLRTDNAPSRTRHAENEHNKNEPNASPELIT